MTCYFPVTLYMSRTINPKTGKRALVTLNEGFRDMPRQVNCGRCEGCKFDRSRAWAVRCVNEAQMHLQNCFLTLTLNDENLVYGGTDHAILYPRHLTLFWKRLRKHFRRRIKYFACGEYGDKSSRPHYHACVFGLDFEDKELWSSKNGVNLYTSAVLDSIWQLGRCTIGDVSFESAAYVARYIMKKRLGWMGQYYEAEGVEPEFVRMSRRPGIGAEWFDKFESDVFPNDFVSIRGGAKVKPPRYYQRRYELSHPLDMEDIIAARVAEAQNRWRDNTPDRLAVRYRIKLSQTRSLLRPL